MACPHCGGDTTPNASGSFCCKAAMGDARRWLCEYQDPYGHWSAFAWAGTPEAIAKAIGGVTYGPKLLKLIQAQGEFSYRKRRYRVILRDW